MNRDSLLDRILAPGAALFDGWSDSGRWTIALPDPIDEFRVDWGQEGRLEEFLNAIRFDGNSTPATDEIPFLGGWVGFISYEAGSQWEGAPARESNPPEPAALFFRHESGFAVSPSGENYRFAGGRVDPVSDDAERVLSRPANSASGVHFASPGGRGRRGAAGEGTPGLPHPDPLPRGEGEAPSGPGRGPALEDSLAGSDYGRAHKEIRRGIARGDYYQVNLTRRYSLRTGERSDPRALYRGLAGPEPPPYSALLLGGDFDVISASPELFLRADFGTRRAEMRPIKGTAPRGSDPDSDRRASEALLASPKDRAENVMIADLCRNDLGRVCEPGSIRVSELCRVRSHRLHHLESTVEGRLLPEIGASELIRATFPPGSVTGAPKRAAVGAISRLEPVARGVYTGIVGYLDLRGRLAFNVAIRTAISSDREVRYHAGGGITWDSRAERESLESEWKADEFFSLLASLRGE